MAVLDTAPPLDAKEPAVSSASSGNPYLAEMMTLLDRVDQLETRALEYAARETLDEAVTELPPPDFSLVTPLSLIERVYFGVPAFFNGLFDRYEACCSWIDELAKAHIPKSEETRPVQRPVPPKRNLNGYRSYNDPLGHKCIYGGACCG